MMALKKKKSKVVKGVVTFTEMSKGRIGIKCEFFPPTEMKNNKYYSHAAAARAATYIMKLLEEAK